jgi:hypothetical protein
MFGDGWKLMLAIQKKAGIENFNTSPKIREKYYNNCKGIFVNC